jgi:hypothetical protein
VVEYLGHVHAGHVRVESQYGIGTHTDSGIAAIAAWIFLSWGAVTETGPRMCGRWSAPHMSRTRSRITDRRCAPIKRRIPTMAVAGQPLGQIR